MAITRTSTRLIDDAAATGKRVAQFEKTSGAETHVVAEVVIGDPDKIIDRYARVMDSAPAGTEGGVCVRQVGAIPSGTNNIGTVNAGTGTFSVSNGNLTALGAATIQEDTAMLDGSTLVAIATLREDVPTMTTSLSGDAQPPKTDSVGRLWVNGSGVTQPVSIVAAIPSGASVIGKVGIDQTTPGTTNRIAASDSRGAVQYNFPAGFQRTTDEPRQVFYDPFDAALDTTDRWNTATAAGGGAAASVAAGVMTLGSGTTINGYSYLTSRTTLMPTIPAWIQNSWAVQIEAGATAGNNAVRFWGAGSVGGTPTSTNPLGATGNGYGFEIDIAGVLQAVVYANGVRTVVASLAASQPTDGAYHRYLVVYRTDLTYWYIDSLASPVATSNFQSPTVQALPLIALAVAHSVAPAASRVFTTAGVAVGDTGKNHTQISDGTFPWRKVRVDKYGGQVVRARKVTESYTAVFRFAEGAVRLDQSFTQVANTNKQWATLHHAAIATKDVRLTKVVVYITAWSVATQGVLELRQISAAPATGNPAITPTPHRRGGTAAEAVALYLPTLFGTEAAVNSPLAHVPLDLGIMGAVSVANPPTVDRAFVLYDSSQEDDDVLPPTLPAGTLDGWAVMLRTVGAPAVRMTVLMRFVEEIP